MKKIWLSKSSPIVFLFLFFGASIIFGNTCAYSKTPAARIDESYGKLPLFFEENMGQTNPRVRFISRGSGYALFLTPEEAVLTLSKDEGENSAETKRMIGEKIVFASKSNRKTKKAVVRMRFKGANKTRTLVGEDKLSGASNYFIGNDCSKWRPGIPNYAKVRYKDVYPGIDVVFYGNHRRLEYDFILTPGTDPSVIRIEFHGAEKMELDVEGNLVLKTDTGDIVQKAPIAYQEIDGRKVRVSVKFQKSEDGFIGFDIGSWDKSKKLVVDPVMVYSTYMGGSAYDTGFGIVVDDIGNAYVVGSAGSSDFPIVNGFENSYSGQGDGFIVKLNKSGSQVLFSVYVGGSSDDFFSGIAIDELGNLCATGITSSNDFPTVNALHPIYKGNDDAFIFKLNANGDQVMYSTFFGGSSYERIGDIAVDIAGNALVIGTTQSSDFPVINAIYPELRGGSDAYIAKISSDGSQAFFATYLGGSNEEEGNGIAIDGFGNAYATGRTWSFDFPVVNGLYPYIAGDCDAFIVKMGPIGDDVIYSTFIGGSSDFEDGEAIAVDSQGNAYVTGFTGSNDFPVINGFLTEFGGGIDAFIFKMDSSGTKAAYSTYIGGSFYEMGLGLALDDSGNAYVTGWTESPNFPAIKSMCPELSGGSDGFILKINNDGSHAIYSSFLGGNNPLGFPSYVELGRDIAIDKSGDAYVTGLTNSTDFPAINAVFPDLKGEQDAFIVKISESITIPTAKHLRRQVVFSGLTDANSNSEELFSIDRLTGKKIRLTDNNFEDGTPAISPDGKTIVFASTQDGEWDLYKMDLDGGNRQNLTNTDQTQNEGWPVFCPDGESFLYKWTDNGATKLAIMDTDGSNRRILLESSFDHAAWSPGGKYIVISGLDGHGGLDLLSMDEGASPIELTQGYYEDYPCFTNDGQYVFFASDRCGFGQGKLGVYFYNLIDQTVSEVICDADCDFRYFSMMKDGRLVFTKAADTVSSSVLVTANPVNTQDMAGLQDEFQNALTLTEIGLNRHPVAPQLYSLTAEIPQRFNPNTQPSGDATKAVVITHGTASGVRKGWIMDLENHTGIADKICNDLGATIDYLPEEGGYINKFTRHCTNGEWDVILADWEIDSYTGPIQAWGIANDVGIKVGEFVIDAGYEHVHMMGHSAGAQVIQQACDYVRKVVPESEKPFIHLTFFDPYDPFAMLVCSGQVSTYGKGADWADNYVDTRPLGAIPGEFGDILAGDLGGHFDATKLFLPNAYNVDVTAWDPFGVNATPVERHAWPYNFYRYFTFGYLDYPMGYLISEESGETFPNPAREIGKACILPDNTSGGAQIECESTETVCEVPDEGTFVFTLDSKAVVFKQVYDSVTGLIDLVTLPDSILETLDDVVSLQLTTSSPVWQEWSLYISESANAIMFDYDFTSDAEGVITVYMDGRAVRRLDERYAAEGLQTSPLIAVGDVYPDEHKLAFRLDPFTAVASEASISNIRFIRFEGAGVVDIDGDGLAVDDDTDDDGDGVKDTSDLFPEDPNEWSDNDGDGVGDAIDNDDDNDQFADEIDNCRLVANSDQSDADGDGIGDACFDSDDDSIPDQVEANTQCLKQNDSDSDLDGIPDGVEDANRDGFVGPGETDPCALDSDNDGISDGQEDANQNGIRDDGELDPLDDDSDDDGVKDGEEQFLGSDPLDKNSRPWIICMDTCASDGSCDACATDISTASTIKSDDAYINYFKVVTGIIEENELTISGNVLVGIESGQVIIQP